jgi:hypothetical protein
VPAEAVAACSGKKLGDACTAMAQAGSCISPPNGSIACLPSGGGPGGPGGGGALDLVAADPIYVSATVRQGSQVWEHVGMRYKGNSSLNSSWGQGIRKLPFRLHFDKYKDEFPATKDQRFFGFEELTFASNWADASFARELLAGRAGLEKAFAVDNFLLMLAVNNTIVNWDSYGQMAHNYYLYGVPSDAGRLQWIPWDFNLSMQSGSGGSMAAGLGSGLSLSMSEVTSSWPLIRYLMDDPIYRAAYRKHLATSVLGAFEAAAFAKRVNELHALIAPHVVGATGEVAPYSTLSAAADVEASAQVLIDHAKARATAVAEELAKP